MCLLQVISERLTVFFVQWGLLENVATTRLDFCQFWTIGAIDVEWAEWSNETVKGIVNLANIVISRFLEHET